MIRLVIFGEDIHSGLIQNQAIAPFTHNGIKFEIVNIHKINNGQYDSRTKNVPIIFPMRLVFSPFIGAISFCYALYISIFVKRRDILVARSYVAGLVCRYIKYFRRNKYIFDTRSMFIQENKRIMKNTFMHAIWMRFEYLIARDAVWTAVVSKYQIEYFARRGITNTYYMPCFFEMDNLSGITVDTAIARTKADSDILILYYGSLGAHWNALDLYYRFFKKANEKNYKVVILSQDYYKLRSDARLCELGNIILLDPASHRKEEVFKICDYGVVLMDKNEDWQSRLSVKFVNYLGAGLKVIINENVGEAVRLLKTEFPDRGIIYSEGDELSLEKNNKKIDEDYWKRYNNIFGYENFLKLLNSLL